MGKLINASTFLAALALAGCGAGPATMPRATQPAQAAQPAVAASQAAEVKSDPIRLKAAYARLSAMPGIVRPGGRASLFLDVWSEDKEIKSYDVRWYASDGFLDRWYTHSSGWNGWWAPHTSFTRTVLLQARVTVRFEDDTSASGTVGVTVWVN